MGPERGCKGCRFFDGVVAVEPQCVKWTFKQTAAQRTRFLKRACSSVHVESQRIQFPLVPALPKTLHGLQGITADPVWLLTLECQMWVPKQSGWHITWCCHGWGAWIIFFAMVYQNEKFWKVVHQRLCKKLWLNCLKARLRPRWKVARKRGPNLVGQKKDARYDMIVWAWCLAQKISCKISLIVWFQGFSQVLARLHCWVFCCKELQSLTRNREDIRWFEWSHFCCGFRGTYRCVCQVLVLMRAGIETVAR